MVREIHPFSHIFNLLYYETILNITNYLSNSILESSLTTPVIKK